ncbi:MAG: YHS domain-containing protein [Candidatus Omnitrophica bacterium]|nr:YHS domain-containing protein [Candidatus Omnitrophota bacterium]
MVKAIFLFLIMGTFVFGMSRLSLAMNCGEHSEHMQVAQTSSSEHNHETMAKQEVSAQDLPQEAVNVGNKICPVSGEKVSQGGMQSATYEYKGKIYNFCCAACIEDFKKDPQKYIKKVEQELQGMHQGHQH